MKVQTPLKAYLESVSRCWTYEAPQRLNSMEPFQGRLISMFEPLKTLWRFVRKTLKTRSVKNPQLKLVSFCIRQTKHKQVGVPRKKLEASLLVLFCRF